MKGKRSTNINIITIMLAIAISAVARLVWFNANQDQDEDAVTQRPPPGVVTLDSLPFDSRLEPVKLDLHNDGGVVVDGVSSSIDGIQALLQTWSKERRVVSTYREPNPAKDFTYTEAVSTLISKAGLATEGRFEPQK